MLITAEVLFIALVALLAAIGIAGNVGPFILGTGFTNPVGPGALIVMIFVLPAFYGLMGILISAGGLLAVYTPLIPYVIFTFGAIAWMISAVEAMVAGPLVALGIISPSGHEIMGKAEPALLLLFAIFLRPSLMIFGLIAAMLLATVVVTMIGATFNYIFQGTLIPSDIISLIFILVAYIGLILAGLNKCFAVINLIPQQVMRWISGQGEQVEAPLQELKAGMDATAGKAAGMGASMEGSTEKGHGRQVEKKREEAEAKKTGVGGPT